VTAKNIKTCCGIRTAPLRREDLNLDYNWNGMEGFRKEIRDCTK
jgi:hypothetical protein